MSRRNQRVLGLIPARQGSKRLVGKNKKMLGGKPLICWTIELAKSVDSITDILVSTDDPEISDIAHASGLRVPWLRPKRLSEDTSASIDVILHAVDWFEQNRGLVDTIVLLQPTTPFRRRDVVTDALEDHFQSGKAPVVSVSLSKAHPDWSLKIENQVLAPLHNQNGLVRRSQELPPVYVPNGSIYIARPDDLRCYKGFYTPRTKALVQERSMETFDIDTQWDFDVAQSCLSVFGFSF